MKGLSYRPNHGDPLEDAFSDKFMKKSKSTLDCRKTNSTPISYMWESSIPQSWIDLAGRHRFINRNLLSKRSTLQFLEETQKYIHKICKPLFPDIENKSLKSPPKPAKQESRDLFLLTELQSENQIQRKFSNEGLRQLLRKSHSNLHVEIPKIRHHKKRKGNHRNSSIDMFLNRFDDPVSSPDTFDQIIVASKVELPPRKNQRRHRSLRENLTKIGAKLSPVFIETRFDGK
ncbi:unnamed protein product [Blepharisma stoltei]|uniref:Uncharacterized protein n=1 Tax=Blepharisma stoltei TaxID=1481888 RepID=A0AAU9IVM2_9CILI|nr:unnamed protein product [Blepharisma stoltei]